MSEFEPGTVAVATVRGVPNVRVMHWRNSRDSGWLACDPNGWHNEPRVTDVRPLVVLDPAAIYENRPSVLRHWEGMANKAGLTAVGRVLAELANQIEEQTKPPKPPEPSGLGAVVEDAEGRRWVRSFLRYGTGWVSGDEETGHEPYSRLNVVRVLSEGVTP